MLVLCVLCFGVVVWCCVIVLVYVQVAMCTDETQQGGEKMLGRRGHSCQHAQHVINIHSVCMMRGGVFCCGGVLCAEMFT